MPVDERKLSYTLSCGRTPEPNAWRGAASRFCVRVVLVFRSTGA